MGKSQTRRARSRSIFGASGIAAQVLLLTVPPLLAILVPSVAVLRAQWIETRDLTQVSHLSALTTGIADLVHELQGERGATAIVSGLDRDMGAGELAAQRRRTEALLQPILNATDTALAKTQAGSWIAAKLALARGNLDMLAAMRGGVDAASVSAEDCLAYYTLTIGQLLDVILEQGVAARDPATRREVFALFGLMQAAERASQERATAAQHRTTDQSSPSDLVPLRHFKAEEESYLQIFRAYADQRQRSDLDRVLLDPASREVETLRALAWQAAKPVDPAQLDRAAWLASANRRLELLRAVEIRLIDDLAAHARAQATAARTWFATMVAMLAGALLALGLLCARTARSLSRPVQQMTRAMVSLAAGNDAVAVPHLDRSDEIGAMAAAVEVFRNNAQVKQERERQIAHMTRHDALTNLPNRAAFRERVEQAMATVGRGSTVAVLSIDLDRFGAINDALGHHVGDQMLRAVAERLQDCTREMDVVARLGGDEFAIVQNGLQRSEDSRLLAERILQVAGAPLTVEGHRLTPELSIGIACAPSDGTSVETLMRCAALALHRAKSDGGRSYCFFEPSMEARLRARRALEADLRTAIDEQAFELHYQPSVDAQSTAITGFEALIRWRHPVRGAISPAEFIPIAEETGLIVPLGRWIIDRACADAATWRKPLWVAVNISPKQFKDPMLVSCIDESLRRHQLPANRLELEITESVLMLDDDTTRAALHKLHAMGVRIAMDDFGTGYSSLSYLRSFPFDKIKIDQSFVRGIGTTGGAEAIVQAVTTLACSLGMTSTAEGVETPEQLATLKAQGCDEIQGYFFSPAKPASEIDAMLGKYDPTFEHGRMRERLLS